MSTSLLFVCLVLKVTACYFNFSVVVAVLRLSKKHSVDILVLGLCLTILYGILITLPSDLYRLTNVHESQIEKPLCFLESYGILITIVIHSATVAILSYECYLVIVKLYLITIKTTCAIQVIIHLVVSLITLVVGIFTPYGVVSGNNYCFFSWDTPLMFYWCIPNILLGAVLTCFFFFRVFLHVHQTDVQVQQTWHTISSNVSEHSLIFARLLLLMLVYVIGIGGMVCMSLFKEIRNHPYSDIVTYFLLLFYWNATPIVYSFVNRRLGTYAAFTFTSTRKENSSLQNAILVPQSIRRSSTTQ